jgi:hypothetical protein
MKKKFNPNQVYADFAQYDKCDNGSGYPRWHTSDNLCREQSSCIVPKKYNKNVIYGRDFKKEVSFWIYIPAGKI